jgi:hypothetical protein
MACIGRQGSTEGAISNGSMRRIARKINGVIGVLTLVCASGARASDQLELGPAAPWVQPPVLPSVLGTPTDAAIRLLLHDRPIFFYEELNP